MVGKIAIVGPESTGKSALAAEIAKELDTIWVPEFARYYLELLKRPYQESDLEVMARGQLSLEKALLPQANKWLICDTNLLVYRIWGEFKYQRVAPFIQSQHQPSSYAFHLLTDIDLPWEQDPQREHPEARQELFDLYQQALLRDRVPHAIVKGVGALRTQHALEAIGQFVTKNL